MVDEYNHNHQEKKWLHPIQLAMLVKCSDKMIRYHLRNKHPYLRAYARKVPGIGWMIHIDSLKDPLLWATLTGTSNRKQWAPAWTGDRGGTKTRRKRLQGARSIKASHPENRL